jgi:hypothetical protein
MQTQSHYSRYIKKIIARLFKIWSHKLICLFVKLELQEGYLFSVLKIDEPTVVDFEEVDFFKWSCRSTAQKSN